MDETREETLPHGVSWWDVFVVEFVPPGQTEWRAFSHGEHDTLEQAEGWIEAQGFDPLLPLRICHYVDVIVASVNADPMSTSLRDTDGTR